MGRVALATLALTIMTYQQRLLNLLALPVPAEHTATRALLRAPLAPLANLLTAGPHPVLPPPAPREATFPVAHAKPVPADHTAIRALLLALPAPSTHFHPLLALPRAQYVSHTPLPAGLIVAARVLKYMPQLAPITARGAWLEACLTIRV